MSYQRVNKAIARKMYYHGIAISLIPCKVKDSAVEGDSMWIQPVVISLETSKEEMNQFDREVISFIHYNCNAELGYYPHYFVKQEDMDAYNMCNLVC